MRVLLAEDHTIVRKGIRSLFEDVPGISIVAEAADGQSALRLVEELEPDVVLMDITMPRLNGLEATRQIRRRWPETRVIILTMHDTEEYVFQMLAAGASGYVLKNAAPAELLLALEAAHRGDFFLSPAISRTVIQEYIQNADCIDRLDPYQSLTEREREVFQLLAEGHSTRAIADLLVISPKTVETHRANLMKKIDVDNLADLTRYAVRRGVIPLE